MNNLILLLTTLILIFLQVPANASEQNNGDKAMVKMVYANSEELRSMVSNEVDLNSLSLYGTNFISYVANLRDSDTLISWIKLGAEVDKENENGSTPLFWAIVGNKVENVEVLLRHGASVNHKDKSGKTPLIKAINGLIIFNSPRIPIILIEAGSDVNVLDKKGNSPLNILRRQQKDNWGYYEKKIEKLLISRGAKDIFTFSTIPLEKTKRTVEGEQNKKRN